jgi:hypothetical protein
MFGTHPKPSFLPRFSTHERRFLPTLPLLVVGAIVQMESAPYQLCLYWLWKMPFIWKSPLPTLLLLAFKVALYMGSASYRLCFYWPWKLLFIWRALPITSTHDRQTIYYTNGKRSLSDASFHWVSPPYNFHFLPATPWFRTNWKFCF